MAWFTYDCEVSAYDWLVVFKEKTSGDYTIIHNDNELLKVFLREDDIYCGFNSKHYDQFILKAIYADFTPQEIKALNDYLIQGGNGWQYASLKDLYFRFNNVDIKDDTQMGLSLKAIEGHFGMSVEETTVDFNLDRPWTEQELQEMFFYCKHDVDTTEHLAEVRKEYLRTKMNIGAMVGISPVKAMSMTNAKLTAAFLQAKPPEKPWTDEREYRIPDNLKREYIPQEVFDFFARMYDKTLSDDEVFKSQLEIEVGGCPVTIAYGGIHGAIPHYMWRQEEHQDTIIRNVDVASYYPHLITINGYASRNMANPQIYADMLEKRMKAKREGDKSLANALKLVANTTYGATLNQYNDLYDPLMARSVCVSGQLYLLELTEHLLRDVPGLKPVQLNTDGLMIEYPPEQAGRVADITREWQDRTGFELEEDKIKAIYQANVNNYVEVAEDGSIKSKGGYLVRGIAPAGAFNVNNNATIVAKAMIDHFVKGTPVEETINACDDIKAFQLIAKAGTKYREAYWMVDGQKCPVQKVNRVYATSDLCYGKIYKVKSEDASEAKIARLPEHCIIDNTAVDSQNHTTIDRIDKSWYIAQALDGINKFLGIEPEKPPKKERKKSMPRTPATEAPATLPMNVYMKLLTARVRFLDENVKKSGKNMKMAFKYFELDDIVPTVMPIFNDLHLLPVVRFTDEEASLTVINCDDPTDCVVFVSPMRPDTSGLITNEIQKLGSVQTYMRRYLYMMALDIVEADEIEAKTGAKPAAQEAKPVSAPAAQEAKPAPKPPVSEEKRAEIREELTNADGQADELLLNALKAAVKKLRLLGGHDDECIKIALDTKAFTEITKSKCQALIDAINKKVEEEQHG